MHFFELPEGIFFHLLKKIRDFPGVQKSDNFGVAGSPEKSRTCFSFCYRFLRNFVCTLPMDFHGAFFFLWVLTDNCDFRVFLTSKIRPTGVLNPVPRSKTPSFCKFAFFWTTMEFREKVKKWGIKKVRKNTMDFRVKFFFFLVCFSSINFFLLWFFISSYRLSWIPMDFHGAKNALFLKLLIQNLQSAQHKIFGRCDLFSLYYFP